VQVGLIVLLTLDDAHVGELDNVFGALRLGVAGEDPDGVTPARGKGCVGWMSDCQDSSCIGST
jgi:hypothetical protein